MGIASGEAPSSVHDFVQSMGLTYRILLDRHGSVISKYSTEAAFPTAAYPQDWIIGTDGTVVYANNAFEADEMKAAIERELE